VSELAAPHAVLPEDPRWKTVDLQFVQQYSEQNQDFWIESSSNGDSAREPSASDFHSINEGREVTVVISMKATVVKVDRSAWFQVSQPKFLHSCPKNQRETSRTTRASTNR
jgi:hypothetical protein